MTFRKRSVWPWIVGTLLMVVLYFLSLGPLQALLWQYPPSPQMRAVAVAYSWPGHELCRHSETVAKIVYWYITIWCPPPPGYDDI